MMGRAPQSAREKTATEKVGVMMWPSWALACAPDLHFGANWPVDPDSRGPSSSSSSSSSIGGGSSSGSSSRSCSCCCFCCFALGQLLGFFGKQTNVHMQRCSLPATRQAIGSNAALTTPVHYALAEGRHHFFQVLLPFLWVPSCFFRSRGLRSRCSYTLRPFPHCVFLFRGPNPNPRGPVGVVVSLKSLLTARSGRHLGL